VMRGVKAEDIRMETIPGTLVHKGSANLTYFYPDEEAVEALMMEMFK